MIHSNRLRIICLTASFVGAGALAGSSGLVNQKPITGKLGGFTELRNGDNILDGALVVPSISPQELLSLQLDALMAPNEDMQAGPATLQVPGNLYFPAQQESYGFFSVNIQKERFTFMSTPGIPQELAALSFQAPFSKLVDMGQSKAPLLKMLSIIKLKKLAFESERDWSQQSSPLRLTLQHGGRSTLRFDWQRSTPQKNEMDLIVNFQQTPAQRWLIADFTGTTARSGSLNQFDVFQPRFKSLFLRVLNPAQDSERSRNLQTQLPLAGAGWVRSPQGENLEPLTLSGAPQFLQGVRLADPQRIEWAPLSTPGWLAILRINQVQAAQAFEPSVFSGLALGLDLLSHHIQTTTAKIEAWVNPADGRYELSTPAGNSTLVLIYVGTDREVPSPALDTMSEPALFTYASEIKFVRIQ